MEHDRTIRATGISKSGEPVEDGANPSFLLASITEKEKEVLDLLIDYNSNKEIALDLGVSENTIEKRLQAIRAKLGTQGRNDTARIYKTIIGAVGKPISGFPALFPKPWPDLSRRWDRAVPDPLTLRDSGALPRRAPWDREWNTPRGLEAIGDWLSPAWRLGITVAIATLLLVIVAVSFTVLLQIDDSGLARLVT